MSSATDPTSSAPGRVLMIVANPGVSEMTRWPIGFWAAELTHPWYEFREAGYEVVVASPDGGEVRADALSDPRDESGFSAGDVLSRGFLEDPKLAGMLEDTPGLAELDLDDFDAIVVCGGQGPMFQFRDHQPLGEAIVRFFEAGKPTAALCHGVAALIDLQLADGSHLIEGRTMTGFANIEEDASNEAVGQTVQPWRIEDAARERHARYVAGGLWHPFAVRDGNLITGQQQYSGRKVAELVIDALASGTDRSPPGG